MRSSSLSTPVTGAVPDLPVIGPGSDGVPLYAAQICAMVARLTGSNPAPVVDDLEGMTSSDGPMHLHFTDRLFGNTPREAADRVVEMAARRPITVTLHDLPQPSDGPDRMINRAAAYRRVADAVDALVCNSSHEAALLREFCRPTTAAEPEVIPLPVIRHLNPGQDHRQDIKAVAILGYFYPGKGHAEIVEAVAEARVIQPRLTDDLTVMALGAPSKGHESDAVTMVAYAKSKAISLAITGFLTETTLADHCRRIAVPAAAHQHVSASGSVNSWIGYGRRPLVPDTRYFREMDQLRPGCLTLYCPSDLPDALLQGLRHPASTWTAGQISLGPDLGEVAGRYLAFWSAVFG